MISRYIIGSQSYMMAFRNRSDHVPKVSVQSKVGKGDKDSSVSVSSPPVVETDEDGNAKVENKPTSDVLNIKDEPSL